MLIHCHRNTGPLHGAHNNTQIYTNQALTKEILQHSHSPTASARVSGNLNNLRRFQKTQVCHTEINCLPALSDQYSKKNGNLLNAVLYGVTNLFILGAKSKCIYKCVHTNRQVM